MGINIVGEIVAETKNVIDGLTLNLKRLPYEYEIEKNNERSLADRYGFIPKAATFREGSSMGFTTMEHSFELILCDDYSNKDSDSSQATATHKLYEKAHCILKDIQKKKLALPTAGYTVLLISGLSFDSPEHFNDNGLVVLRAEFIITYRFRNNL